MEEAQQHPHSLKRWLPHALEATASQPVAMPALFLIPPLPAALHEQPPQFLMLAQHEMSAQPLEMSLLVILLAMQADCHSQHVQRRKPPVTGAELHACAPAAAAAARSLLHQLKKAEQAALGEGRKQN